MTGPFLDLLKQGGFILYARHGEANVGVDQPDLRFQDCFTQRNLTDWGRRQAVYYGDLIRYLRIPLAYPVLASPFCRSRETAQLAFGRDQVRIDPFWSQVQRLSGDISWAEQRIILARLRSALERTPPKGSNRMIVAHSFPSGVGLGSIPNMGTVVIQPRGQGKGYRIVGQFSLEELSEMVRE